jgi:membrane-associated phospholipid phosphatase
MFIVLVPTLGAALVSGTRIIDARHHPFDVLFGGAVGIVIAWIAYRQYFPSLSKARTKVQAYPMVRTQVLLVGSRLIFAKRTWGSQRTALETQGNVTLDDTVRDDERSSTVPVLVRAPPEMV